jgi:hypothetical protein
MTKLIDKATAHFKDAIAQGVKGPIRVEEWDADIYYRATTNMAQESKVIELTQQNKTTEALIITLIQKACDENGEPLFTAADKAALMNRVDPKIILKIVTSMNDDDDLIEEAVGN